MQTQKAMEVFHIKNYCPKEELKALYYRLAKENHPDKANPEDIMQKERRMQEITEAYTTLKNQTEQSWKENITNELKETLYHQIKTYSTFTYQDAHRIEQFCMQYQEYIQRNFLTKLFNVFYHTRLAYHYKKEFPFLYEINFPKSAIFTKKEFAYIKELSQTIDFQTIAKDLEEIDVIVQDAVKKDVEKQIPFIKEYWQIMRYPYTDLEKESLLKTIRSKQNKETKKQTFHKQTLFIEITPLLEEYAHNVCVTLDENLRTYAREEKVLEGIKQALLHVVENKLDAKPLSIQNNKISSRYILTHLSTYYHISKETIRLKNDLFLFLGSHHLSFKDEEIEQVVEIIKNEVMRKVQEKTIEPPKYVLRQTQKSL